MLTKDKSKNHTEKNRLLIIGFPTTSNLPKLRNDDAPTEQLLIRLHLGAQ